MEELQELIKFLKAKGFTNTKIDVDLLFGIIEHFGSKQENKQSCQNAVSKSALKFRCFYANGFAIQGEPDLETLGSFMHHYSDYELQQSTGLKDANGKEIFEGDFLQFMHHLHKVFRVNGGLVINTHSDDFYKNYMPFYEACADMQTSQWIEQCKIIGNINQNPELLIKPN